MGRRARRFLLAEQIIECQQDEDEPPPPQLSLQATCVAGKILSLRDAELRSFPELAPQRRPNLNSINQQVFAPRASVSGRYFSKFVPNLLVLLVSTSKRQRVCKQKVHTELASSSVASVA